MRTLWGLTPQQDAVDVAWNVVTDSQSGIAFICVQSIYYIVCMNPMLCCLLTVELCATGFVAAIVPVWGLQLEGGSHCEQCAEACLFASAALSCSLAAHC